MVRSTFLVCGITIFLAAGEAWAQKQSFHTAAGKAPEAGSIFIFPERIPLKQDGMVTVERAMMFVPLNRSKPDSDVIMLDVYRFPRAATTKPDSPPLFILNGGPGFAGLETALRSRGHYEQRYAPMTLFSDIVIVGQRGIGSSKPDTNIEQIREPTAVDQPVDTEGQIQTFREQLTSEREAWEKLGVDLQGYTVVEAAADVRDVAKALGYDKIVLWGGSFGSHWGMTIMRNHPEIVARAVLTGMEGPDHTYDHPGWIWNVYKRVAEEAEASGQIDEWLPDGGLVAAAKAQVDKATKDPFTVTVKSSDTENDVWVDGEVMKGWIRRPQLRLASWPAHIIELHNGKYDLMARQTYGRSKSRGREFRTASYWMLDTGSGITAERLAEFEADPAQEIIGSTYSYYTAGCPAWPSDLGDEFRQNFETDIPTVIVHGTWDTSTPYENALELAPFFKNSKFVTVKRGSHGALFEAFNRSPRFRNAVMNFVVTGKMDGIEEEIEIPAPKWTEPDLDD